MVMLSTPVRRFASVLLLAAALLCGRAAVANVSSVQTLLDGGFRPSEQPGLLGPITETGRTGWACKPEKAAEAATVRDAELPPAEDGR